MFKGLINRPIAVTMVLIATIVLGIAAIRELPVSLMPDIDIPQITVQVTSPDRSARELNDLLIAPLRMQLVQVPHLTDITCTARDGSGLIQMTFEYGADADYIFIDVNERVDRATTNWPIGEERPLIARASATDIPAFFINVSLKEGLNVEGNSFLEMSDFTRQVIVRRLEQLPQVAMVDISGQVFPQLLIVPDMEKLRALGIDEDQLSNAIQGSNVRLGNLSIRDGEYRFNVRFESSVVTREDVENVWLKLGGRTYQIKDLAQVSEEQQRINGMVTGNGSQCVTLAVIKRSDARMADLRDGVHDLMAAFERDYPNLEFQVTRDQTELLDYSISNMISNLLFGALFACCIIFFFMQDFRSPLLVVITIPTALIISFLFFYVIGISINIISLSGLVLGLGMMVDNSIITIDNITQRWQKGEPLDDACVLGTQEVFAPMLSSVLTTCAVFIPLIFMSGIAGALFYDEAMAVTITLLSALLVSVMVIPVFYYRLYRKQPCFRPNSFISRFGIGNMTKGYEHAIRWLFRRRGVMWSVFGIAVALIGVLFVNLEKEKMPAISHSDTLLNIEWNQRISVEENNRRCEEIMAQFPDRITQYTCMTGAQQFALSHTRETGLSEAIIYMKARSAEDITDIESEAMTYIFNNWPDAAYGCQASGNVFDMLFPDTEAPLVARIKRSDGSTPEPDQLTTLLSSVSAALPGVEIQPSEWNEHIELITDPERLALYDVSYNMVLGYLRNAMNAGSVLRISKGDISMPVMIGMGDKEARDLIQGSYINTRGGRVPLEILLKETRNRDLKSITSGVDGEYYPLPLEVSGKEARHTMDVIEKVVREDERFDVSFTGAYFNNRQMIRELSGVLVISLLLLFFILAAQFESLIQPLIILSELIIDIFAVLAVLWLCGESLNLMSMIGMVVMCGIAINDSILKVDTINRLLESGYGLKHAILEAGKRRLNAIIMTSLTTILAIAPFLVRGDMGSDLQYPLSLALISGMVAGTLVSIFFVPLAYYEIYKKRYR
ncbi:MAG TPA: efflux RND transporter permease subunit [Bacteroidaceae bacterium]|jgi:multidrug efflux pump subunit AcrB|nr:efflux RND transporter permease subunit [Bacteroidaceae bacterium]OPZ48710.1 MAG: Efflux pump membrane transporter BepE [Bacteroidetes bacterium ADurb.BinA104]MBP8603140.1 efflux RND transporter permease subunit [Bacteroidaceae bacterium]HOD69215.1 efflux RND transporter permease subunit [Bacteroidaceae bacterium]HPX98859.1 efflux RND transporter permease subunit [Bacteroidaceae bacterium]